MMKNNMKKIICLISFIWVAALTATAQNSFKISGTVANMPDGTVTIVSRSAQDNSLDSLGSTSMKNGVFELTGRVEAGCLALLVMPDMQTGFQLMLENADYTLNVTAEGTVTINGGKAQTLFNEFAEVDKSIAAEGQKVESAARSARSNEQIISLQNHYNSFVEKAQEKRLELIRTNGDCFVSAYIPANIMQNIPLETLKELYGNFSGDIKGGHYASLIANQIAQMEKVAVGAVCPEFSVLTPEGQPISLADIKGKVKVIDFWASWCQPCRNENPRVVKMYEKYHSKGLEIFGVSLDTDKAAWEQAIADDELPWPQGSELLQVPQVAILFGIKAIPHIILLDENNRIVAKDLRGKALEKKIAELLGAN